MTSILRADVHVSSRLPLAIQRIGESSAFSPISCTLIHGNREAVLVDTPISISQTASLIKWIEGVMPNKELIYVRWPNLKAVATKATVELMKRQLTPEYFDNFWLKMFTEGQIYQPQEVAQPMETDTFEIEGHTFRAIEVGHTDTIDTTILHVPDIHLVVAGDAVYGDVHQFFGEANTTAKREEWLKAIEIIESLNPHTVVAGHKREGSVDGIYNIAATKEYIRAFDSATKTCKSMEELYEKMQQLYPNRINPHAILAGATAAFKDEASK